MLHTNRVHCGLGQCIRQLRLKYSSSNIYVYSSLYDTALDALCLNFALALIAKLAERITGETLNNFNIKQYGKYRTREYPRGTAREFTWR